MEKTEKDLSKLFKSAEELIEPEEGVVTGQIPNWLNGSFIRVGPAKWDLRNCTLNHVLDGYALLSKFEIKDSRIKFQKRYLQSDAYLKATMAGVPLLTEFATKAHANPHSKKAGLFSRIISSLTPMEMTDNTHCSFFQIAKDDIFVTSNTTFFRKIDPNNLSTGTVKYNYSKLFGLEGVSVHPLRDEVTGDVYNMGFSVMTGPKYHIIRIPTGTKYSTSDEMMSHYTTLCSIPSRWNTSIGFFHSFGLSLNYVVFIEIPYVISLTKAVKSIMKGDAFSDSLEWKGEEYVKFVLINKKTGKIRKVDYVAPKAFFFLHICTCYEENNHIVIDINAYGSPSVLDTLYMKNLRCNHDRFEERDPPSIIRFIIPLIPSSSLSSIPESVNLIPLQHNYSTLSAVREGNTIILNPEIMSDPGLELPTSNPNFLSKKTKYIYAAGSIPRNGFSNSVCKINVDTKESILWKDTEWDYPGEPLFIPMRDAEEEDDGILISAVTNARGGKYKDFIVFLDPKTMNEVGRATFEDDIPQAMHGLFLKN